MALGMRFLSNIRNSKNDQKCILDWYNRQTDLY